MLMLLKHMKNRSPSITLLLQTPPKESIHFCFVEPRVHDQGRKMVAKTSKRTPPTSPLAPLILSTWLCRKCILSFGGDCISTPKTLKMVIKPVLGRSGLRKLILDMHGLCGISPYAEIAC